MTTRVPGSTPPRPNTGSARPRQADVAAAAGVSQATVSLVLGDNPERLALSEATRERVALAARSLGYVPNPVARRLAAASTDLLGVFTFSHAFPVEVRDSYYPFLVGVERAAARLGYDLLLFTGTSPSNVGDDGADSAAVQKVRLADGCLFLGRRVPEVELDRLLACRFPIVYIGRRTELGGRLSYVGADYVAGAAQVVDHLVGLGHRRLLYLRGTDDVVASTDREDGFRRAVAASGEGVQGEVLRAYATSVDARALRAWRERGISVVVTEENDTNDLLAALLTAAREDGARIPQDLSIALLGEDRSLPESEVTGFRIPRQQMGEEAAALLVDLVTGARSGPVQWLLEPTFLPGTTTGPPAVSGPAAVSERTPSTAAEGDLHG
ncbi:LacI family DNA-binding transcriptional regulator [Actinoalloteichus hymeniacidonis]|uniref:Transcriptional regulator, LacI family n=1 Tax=Actinoalloteichus hymeniacidonis TaxID=340345 RepID=A0AAC9MZA9_9PSEU|nr:LacI family DNA-binding transcriptional regulator [Actinoalloteichus hymeniacidonis]AOS63751.1 transcriptional regulator, LacI family [Actinoalloteichus hymeniacidonis]MBB5908195.1 DNA-binding LacI/PurR family transcriptional regulator [Actinoalloteichus hymeniacidonis]